MKQTYGGIFHPQDEIREQQQKSIGSVLAVQQCLSVEAKC